ncbi:type I polyketide synthase, partial [Streptomyces sp. NPDC055287]
MRRERPWQGTPQGTGEHGEAVAVIGMACRLPKSPDPEAFWDVLRTGSDAVTDAPEGRWDLPGTGGGDGERFMTVRRGGFLDRVDLFDADFFSVSPREAEAMDPQQRLVLELSWEALENAGIVPAVLHGSDTAVYAGVMADDYALLHQRCGAGAVTRHSMTGLHRGIVANRVSYTLGLRGPSIVVDTGQSSSLVAVHLACENLLQGGSALALAAGVNLNLAGETTRTVSAFGALSPDGYCRTFDAGANGYVRGEGGVVLVLKRLSDALADGDEIHSVILGSAVNNDGATESLTRPSAAAQRDVIAAAHRRAGISPDDVDYVELHGTGTRVGDPVEAAALGEAFAAGSGAGRPPVAVGSVKTNVGHLEGAAGIVGLLKVVLSIRQGQIPPSLNFESAHPRIPLPELGLYVNETLAPWPDGHSGRLAGVSSFGMGGTNCHMVVADLATTGHAPPPAAAPGPGPEGGNECVGGGVVPWVVSGRGVGALRDQARRLHGWVSGRVGLSVGGVGRALAVSRSQFEERAVVVGRGRGELLAGLEALAEGRPSVAVVRGRVTAGGRSAFVFTGQGSQYPGMGQDLYRTCPPFAQALDEACAAFEPHLEHPLQDVMWGNHSGLLTRTDYTQPALFALETALFRTLEAWDVHPDYLAGHSIGELTAAHAAGILTLTDAARLVTARGHLMHTAPTGGIMTAINATETEIRPHLNDHVALAAVNSPTSLVIAGHPDHITTVTHHFHTLGRKTRPLTVSHAFHSPHMNPVLN